MIIQNKARIFGGEEEKSLNILKMKHLGQES
jgi:hypothetical protein